MIAAIADLCMRLLNIPVMLESLRLELSMCSRIKPKGFDARPFAL
jgi:hypothetical protein